MLSLRWLLVLVAVFVSVMPAVAFVAEASFVWEKAADARQQAAPTKSRLTRRRFIGFWVNAAAG
jgi:hypothetical protein